MNEAIKNLLLEIKVEEPDAEILESFKDTRRAYLAGQMRMMMRIMEKLLG